MNNTAAHTPLVSVILLTIDRPQFIEAAIQSVVNQSYSTWELIVLHDGPDSRIEPVVAKFSSHDSRVQYIHRENIGNIASGLNCAIRRSRGEFIAILDDDDAWIEPKKLERQVAALLSDVALMAIGGGAVVVDSAGREVMRYRRSIDPEACARRALLANPLIHSTVLYRRDAAERVGLYDEGLAGYQDWDLFLKIMRIGKVANLEGFFATYRVWDGGGTSRHVLANAWSALRIVNRHGRYYRGYLGALAASLAYVAFALLPGAVRRRSYQSLSRFKKKVFSG
jgi:glycosyltransferase involved in cell wall biosynthesis